jgi:hypothetical protein
MRKTAAAAACIGMAMLPTAISFTPAAPLKALGVTRSAPASVGLAMQADSTGARRMFLRQVAGGAVVAGSVLLEPANAPATVFFDTERYGDKELKVALINKVKQQLRALFEKKPELLVPFFRLALTDALSFDKASGVGGLDGSVMKKLELPENADLAEAAKEVS